jgi:hypothetical protein
MNTPSPCNKCDHLYWDPMYEEDPIYEAECKKGLPMGDKNCPGFEPEKLCVLFKDLPDSDHPGKTIGEVNLEKKHNIPEGSLVEVERTGIRLFVVNCGRDCDNTPLYWLAADKGEIRTYRHAGGYQEKDLRVIE